MVVPFLELLLDLTEGHPVGVVTGDRSRPMSQNKPRIGGPLRGARLIRSLEVMQRPSKIGSGLSLAKHRVFRTWPAANPGKVSVPESDAGAQEHSRTKARLQTSTPDRHVHRRQVDGPAASLWPMTDPPARSRCLCPAIPSPARQTAHCAPTP